MWGIHHRNSSLPLLCRLRWGEEPQNRIHYFLPRVYKTVFLFTVIGKPVERDQQESLVNASQNTATKPEPAQYNSVQISLVSYWMEPTGRLHVSLNSISTALSCSLHPAVRSGKAPRLHKKEYFVSEKKKSTMYLANSQAMSWQRRQFPCSRVLCILMINSCG